MERQVFFASASSTREPSMQFDHIHRPDSYNSLPCSLLSGPTKPILRFEGWFQPSMECDHILQSLACLSISQQDDGQESKRKRRRCCQCFAVARTNVSLSNFSFSSFFEVVVASAFFDMFCCSFSSLHIDTVDGTE